MIYMPIYFSVVIPTYNRAEWIEKTLNSVFNQTYPHFEVIVVDDCSTDNTHKVLQPFIENNQIRYIRNEVNSERAVSRNVGMAAAKGDFLTLLDSDDLMYPNCLADAAAFAKKNSDLKCFQNQYELIDITGKTIYRFPFPSLKNQLKAIAEGNFMACIGDFIHRDIYQNYRFDTTPEIITSEDWEFWLRVLADYKVGRIDKINHGAVQHDERSMTNRQTEHTEKGLEYIYNKILQDKHLFETYQKHLRNMESNMKLFLAGSFRKSGDKIKSAGYLRKAVEIYPPVIFGRKFLSVLQSVLLSR